MSQPNQFRALSDPNFRIYFCGQIVSMTGGWIQVVALGWLVFRLTDSSFWVGVVGFATGAATFLASPISGVISDRVERRKFLAGIELACIVPPLLLTILLFIDNVELWQIILIALAIGIGNGFEMTARQAFVADLVPPEFLRSAISMNLTAYRLANVVAPFLAGAVIDALSETWCFALNAASYVAIITGLLLMKIPAREKLERKAGSFREELMDGVSYVKNHKAIPPMFLIIAALFFSGAQAQVFLPEVAKDLLQGDAEQFGIIRGTYGIGAFVGSILIGFAGATAFAEVVCGCFLGLSISYLALSLSTHTWLSALASFGIGFCFFGAWPVLSGAVQQIVTAEKRGKITGLMMMVVYGTSPITQLVGGAFASHWSVSTACYIISIFSVLASIGFALRFLRPGL